MIPPVARRAAELRGFSIGEVARAAQGDPDVLRLENLDTDLPPPRAAIEATRAGLEAAGSNSYLPFEGRHDLRAAVVAHVARSSAQAYDPERECVITAGGTEGLLNALLATVDPGHEVILADPTYAGMIERVRLAGATPRFVSWVQGSARPEWRLDIDGLARAVTRRTRALFLMNPSMPSGGVLNEAEWGAVAAICREHDLWLLYNAAMERILYDGRPLVHPASLPGMRERTLIIGSVSKEYRMIGWRVGWVVGPAAALAEVGRVGLYNVVTPVGIGQPGALAALTDPDQAADVARATARWEGRRDTVMRALASYPVRAAAGGWSLLLDAGAMGLAARDAWAVLLEKGRVAATPMDAWGGEGSANWVRLVFSNERKIRLAELGDRFARVF